tara:strand:+ start:400 stop:501 length:102 start_codon:yes stop_codon:yes gene_type:complete
VCRNKKKKEDNKNPNMKRGAVAATPPQHNMVAT